MNNTDQRLPIIRSFQVAPENQEKNNSLVRVDKHIYKFRIGKHSQSDTGNQRIGKGAGTNLFLLFLPAWYLAHCRH